MLIPEDLFMVREYDAVYVVSPTSKYGHNSDNVFGTVEMLVENTNQGPAPRTRARSSRG